MQPEFNPWLAQYLVMKRVSIEPNFHSLYSEFLQALSVAELSQMVLDETYRNIKVNFKYLGYIVITFLLMCEISYGDFLL